MTHSFDKSKLPSRHVSVGPERAPHRSSLNNTSCCVPVRPPYCACESARLVVFRRRSPTKIPATMAIAEKCSSCSSSLHLSNRARAAPQVYAKLLISVVSTFPSRALWFEPHPFVMLRLILLGVRVDRWPGHCTLEQEETTTKTPPIHDTDRIQATTIWHLGCAPALPSRSRRQIHWKSSLFPSAPRVQLIKFTPCDHCLPSVGELLPCSPSTDQDGCPRPKHYYYLRQG